MVILGPLALTVALVAHAANDPAIGAGHRTRGLVGGWGHSWPYAVPGWGKTRSDISFFAFHPRMGWFVAKRLEIYGEGTLLIYQQPATAVSAGLGGLAGRLYWATDRTWMPYATLGAGLLWTSLDVREIDRIFNFQIFYGAGVRQVKPRGPGLMIELRNHHISNAGTRGDNLGVNALTLLAGVEWTLR
jgi:lipid A 3-O-deacylase